MNQVSLEIPYLFCSLGEGPSWDTETQSLCFVDINNEMIYNYQPHDKLLKMRKLDSRPGCILQTDDAHKYIIATQKGIELTSFDESQENVLLLQRIDMEKKELNRFNDGKVDPTGRIWVGSMACDCKGTEGSLYCYNSNNSWSRERENVGISNGLAWTKDKKNMYYIDSTPKKIYGFDYDEVNGKITNERVVFELKEDSDSVPDGMTIDSDDCLWVAIWGGEKILRINPKTGEILLEVKIPGAKNITSCCFGGENLTTLFITSASCDTDTNVYTHAGGLFRYEVPNGISGVPISKFHLEK